MKAIIITTINPKTKAVAAFENVGNDWQLTLVGDKKSATISNSPNLTFLSVEEQRKSAYKLAELLPFNHYARKNLGYLHALKNGATIIYDTDDDNLPYPDWGFPPFDLAKASLVSKAKYYNIYSAFSDENIWPRGYPLNRIAMPDEYETTEEHAEVGVWQGLADMEPDVDAIFRLVFNKEIYFKKENPKVLGKGVYCPFNSQNTFWRRDLLPYAYLPSTVTFRFTDILRGYIAQRCIWEHGRLLGFTKATVYQERNEHNLMKDFESEVPCYLETEKVVNILDSLSLKADYAFNLTTVYKALLEAGIVKKEELSLVNAWIEDLKTCL